MKKHALVAAVLTSLGAVASPGAQAATLNNGDILRITAATLDATGQVSGGSYFAVDPGDGKVNIYEKVALAEGATGLVIGVVTTPGAYHPAAPTAGDTNDITAPYYYNGSTGSWYSTLPITGSTTAGLDMSGWDTAWDTQSSVSMAAIAWQPLNCAELGCTGYTFMDGIGRFQWDGVYGHAYTLDYASTVPPVDPSCFCQYPTYTHLEGIVAAAPVPIPAAAWLFGSGLMGLLGLARRK